MLFVYAAGPYTKPDPVINTNRAIRLADHIFERGHTPFIPHLTMFWHLVIPRAYQDWLDYDVEWLKKCDVVIRLLGESNGADKEVEIARELMIPVILGGESEFDHYLKDRVIK